MSELLSLIFTPQVRMVLVLMGVCVVMLYLLSIVYVIKDARARGAAAWWAWGIVSVIPLVGLVAYLILRPNQYAIDRDEQEIENLVGLATALIDELYRLTTGQKVPTGSLTPREQAMLRAATQDAYRALALID